MKPRWPGTRCAAGSKTSPKITNAEDGGGADRVERPSVGRAPMVGDGGSDAASGAGGRREQAQRASHLRAGKGRPGRLPRVYRRLRGAGAVLCGARSTRDRGGSDPRRADPAEQGNCGTLAEADRPGVGCASARRPRNGIGRASGRSNGESNAKRASLRRKANSSGVLRCERIVSRSDSGGPSGTRRSSRRENSACNVNKSAVKTIRMGSLPSELFFDVFPASEDSVDYRNAVHYK